MVAIHGHTLFRYVEPLQKNTEKPMRSMNVRTYIFILAIQINGKKK